jgi:DNA-binding transcriptional LysR family regulator
MQLDTIQAFVAVARAGSFAEAGRRLQVPRSTLSKQIQRLERSLGVQLMARTTRAVRLTEAGRGYFERCAHALDELSAATASTREAGGQPKGLLRVALPIDIARTVVARMLPDFRRRYPEVALKLTVGQRMVDIISEGFDLSLRGGPALADSSLTARKICSHVFQLYASPRYLNARGTPAHPRELAQHDLLGFAPGEEPIPWQLTGPDGTHTVVPRAWLQANELSLLQRGVIDGLGIGLGEAVSFERELAEGIVQRVLPGYSMPGGTLYAVYPSARRVPLKVRVFLELLRAHVRAYGWTS